MSQGYGTIVIKNPQGKHSLGVGVLNKLNLIFEGSLGSVSYTHLTLPTSDLV